jgi:hypothetical protein
MGRRRPHPLLLAAAVLVAVLGSAEVASSQPARSAVHRGAVDADGHPTLTPEGWRVTHPTEGTYRVVVDGDDVRLDVRNWEAVADVIVLPAGHGANEVRFSVDGRPTDSAFGFVAVEHH